MRQPAGVAGASRRDDVNLVPDASTVKQALSAHAAIGLLAGALLYLVCLSGSLLVFYEEWQRIEQPNAPALASISPEAVQKGVETIFASVPADKPLTYLYVHLPEPELPRATVMVDEQAMHMDAGGNLVMREEIAWSDFLYAVHYTLQIPGIWGITIVGVLGVMIVALSLTGVLAHPRIFRDAFRLRARSNGGVGLADWHNRMSVWTLPFSLAIALTGAIIGLATLTSYGLAERFYGGDVEAPYEPVFGEHPHETDEPGRVPNVAAALRTMEARYPGVDPVYVFIHDPRTEENVVQITAEQSRRLIFGEYYDFGPDGAFRGTVGLSDGELGQQAAASIYNLHFGNYGGLIVKIAYFVFGIALTAICATGTYIWLGKRRRRGIVEPRLRAAWHGVVWGAPAAFLVTFVLRLTVGNEAPFTAVFWGGLALAIVGAILLAGRKPAAEAAEPT
jgi:uncharacterized iron-regulated membrane protein